ncbi:hypothetical protein XH89_10045 [Bradyrhizobium sp. CCBAU 53340]|nr:hypothetical protein XH89_10045 [Bradyrhizobium sp. CCBAU 53340]
MKFYRTSISSFSIPFCSQPSTSFRKAAEESGRSPSAVSMQVREPDERIGVLLFAERHRRYCSRPRGGSCSNTPSEPARKFNPGWIC